MDTDEIKAWLASSGRDRHWLGTQIGATKGTIDQWFYRGFPEWATKSIKLLMQPQRTPDTLEVNLTTREFERIEEARKISGHPTRPDFYRDAIIEFTDRILQSEKDESKIEALPSPGPNIKSIRGTKGHHLNKESSSA